MFNIVPNKAFYLFACISGAAAILLGAFAAHGLKPIFSDYQLDIWNKAVFYQIIHSLVLLIASLCGRSKVVKFSQISFCVGILLFSGSLYLLAASGIKILGIVTPIGGVAFVMGWLALAWFGFQLKGDNK